MTQPRRLDDPTVGEWVTDRLSDPRTCFGQVGTVVPTGFEAVVRVLHPPGDGRTWAQVAAANGTAVHPLAQWSSVDPRPDGPGRSSDVDPAEGSVPGETLAAVLEHCPASGDLTYAVWTGFGSWVDRGDERWLMPGWGGRDYRLFRAPPAPLTTWPRMDDLWPQSANLIWPDDHAWCIATEIDWDSTLVAGSAAQAAAITADPRLEAYEVSYTDDLSWFGDTVNPRPPWMP